MPGGAAAEGSLRVSQQRWAERNKAPIFPPDGYHSLNIYGVSDEPRDKIYKKFWPKRQVATDDSGKSYYEAPKECTFDIVLNRERWATVKIESDGTDLHFFFENLDKESLILLGRNSVYSDLEDYTFVFLDEDETEIDPAADAGIVTPDQGEEEY